MPIGSVEKILDNMVDNINKLVSNVFDILMKDNSNIIGVGLGSKFVGNVQTGTPSMTYLVNEKVPLSQLAASEVIPPMKHGVVTDVISVGSVELLASNLSNQEIIEIPSQRLNNNSFNVDYHSATSYYNPKHNNYGYLPQGGESCKFYNSNKFGTVSCLVRDDLFMYLLSNNHVLNGMTLNSSNLPIFCSGNSSNNPVATLSRYADIKYIDPSYEIPHSNRIDAAIANVGKVTDLSGNVRSNIAGNNIKGITSMKIGETVQKYGASTGLTNGKVILLNAAIKVKDKNNNKTAIFTGQTITTPMANNGDSGSLGLNSNSSAFGLLFAGSDKISVYNPIDEVLNKLGVGLL